MQKRRKLIRVATVPLSLKMFCKELLVELCDEYDTLAVSSSGPEMQALVDAGIPTAVVEMRRDISIASDLRSLWQLYRLLRRERPDIVHSLTPKAGLLAMCAAALAGVPVRIHSFTGLLFPTATGLKKTILKTTDRITCLAATHILPEGQGVKHDLEQAHITSKPLTVLGNGNLRGIDLDYYRTDDAIRLQGRAIRERHGIAEGDFVFLFVGRVVNNKGMTELARAFSRLADERADVHLLLAGNEEPGDPLTPASRSIIQEHPRIHAIGTWIDDVRPYYAAADTFVFPSYREGFPNVVLEAGAMQLPSIVTDINGSREIIQQCVNGAVIPVKDAEALYRAMAAYAADRRGTAAMGQRSRDIIAARFEAGYVRNCLKNYYRKITE